MGLAGRKEKQRIPADPRNLSWADDASRFGLSYLSKFGWDGSQGLGTSGDGMKTHIRVQQKLDMMGIGAQHRQDPNGTAWKQNKDFEALLKRLNDGERDGFEAAVTSKKREHKCDDNIDGGRNEKRQKSIPANAVDSVARLALSPSESPSEPTPKPRPMAHRARIRAAKRIADKSASAISEILGIAPSSTMPTPTPTPPCSFTPQPSLELDNLTTSAKSVADYFKEKLLAHSSSSSSPPSSSAPSVSATPGPTRLRHSYLNVSPSDDEDEIPRRGIGSRAPTVLTPLYALDSGPTSDAADTSDGTQYAPTEEQCRKVEKRKLREAVVSQTKDGDDAAGADGKNALTEKQRRKAERKAERRKRREAEATHTLPERDAASGTTAVQKQTKDADAGPDCQDASTKKQRRKAARKAKRSEVDAEVDAGQVPSEGASITERLHQKGDGDGVEVESIQTTSKKKCRERKQQAPAGQPSGEDSVVAKEELDPAVASSPLPQPQKRSKKEHKKKRS